MRGLLCFLLLCCWACVAAAATVQGVIFDEETRNPLARTRVTMVPLPGNPAAAVSLLANERGAYVFNGVQPGWQRQ